MRFNLILESNNPPERLAELALLAEQNGFDGIWISNMHDGRDPFVNLVDAARATSKIHMGPVAVSPYELHPLKMGTSLLTLNEIAEGRAHLGIAAGDGGTAFAMGMKAERRLRAVRETVDIIEAMGSAELVKYEGEMYQVRWVHPTWVPLEHCIRLSMGSKSVRERSRLKPSLPCRAPINCSPMP